MSDSTFILETSAGTSLIPVESRLLSDRKVFITDEINAKTAMDLVKKIMFLQSTPEPIDIYINSPGGEVTSGLLIYDMLQSCENEINMYCTGIAASMAAVLFASGQKGRRFILPHSKVMIHEVLVAGGIGGSATSISKISQSVLETRDMMNDILAKHTGKTPEEIKEATSFDNYMTAEQAVSFGICDEIRRTL